MRLLLPTFVAALSVLTATSTRVQAAEAAVEKQPIIACQGNEKNLKTYVQIHKVLFTDRDATRVEEFYAPELLSHNKDTGRDAGRDVPTRVKAAQMAAMWVGSKKNNPDRVLADDMIICAGDYVIVRTFIHSSDTTGVDGNPPTGKPYVISGIDIYRFENGKVAERWGNNDLLSMYQQIGYTMTPPAAAPAPSR